MTSIPFEVLSLIIGVSIVIPILAYMYRTKFPMSMAFLIIGASWLIIFVTTDNLQLGFSETANENQIREDDIDKYSQLTRTGALTLRNGSNIFVGERVNSVNSLMYNKDIDELCVALGKTGAPTGTAIIGIYNTLATPTTTNVIYQFGTIDVSTLPTTGLATYCFQHISDAFDYSLFLNVAFGVFYNGGSVGNNVNIDVSTANPYDGTNTIEVRYQSSWTAENASDIYGLARLNIVVENNTNTIEAIEYPLRDSITLEPTFIGLVFLMLSLSMIVIGALIEVKWNE